MVEKDFEIWKFKFDKIFLPKDPPLSITINSSLHVLKGVAQGYNGCILAYGQTGSGKTYTILGDK